MKKFRDVGIGEWFVFASGAVAGGPFEKVSPRKYRRGGSTAVHVVGSVATACDVVSMPRAPSTFGELAAGDVFRFVGSHPTPGVSRLGPYRKTGTGSTFRPDDEPTDDDGAQVDTCPAGVRVERIAGAPDWSSRAVLFLELSAGTDGNGNGRRGFLFLSASGDFVACVDAYAGRADWMRRAVKARRLGDAGRIRVPAGELRDFLRMSKESDR